MPNPWTKKEPLYEHVAQVRQQRPGHCARPGDQESKRELTAAQAHAMRQILDFWSGDAAAPAKKKRRR